MNQGLSTCRYDNGSILGNGMRLVEVRLGCHMWVVITCDVTVPLQKTEAPPNCRLVLYCDDDDDDDYDLFVKAAST